MLRGTIRHMLRGALFVNAMGQSNVALCGCNSEQSLLRSHRCQVHVESLGTYDELRNAEASNWFADPLERLLQAPTCLQDTWEERFRLAPHVALIQTEGKDHSTEKGEKSAHIQERLLWPKMGGRIESKQPKDNVILELVRASQDIPKHCHLKKGISVRKRAGTKIRNKERHQSISHFGWCSALAGCAWLWLLLSGTLGTCQAEDKHHKHIIW